MKLRKLLDRFQTLYQGDINTEETPLSDRHIFAVLQSVRNRLLADQIKRKQKINNSNYTILPCVELVSVPSHECTCLGDLGCNIYRTKYPLPKVLTDNQRHLIEYVSAVDNSLQITEATRDSFRYVKGNKYTSKASKYIYENNHLYFPLPSSTPKVIRVKFLSEDLVGAFMYPSFCGGVAVSNSCMPMEELDFTIDGNLEEALVALSKQELLGEMKSGMVSKAQPQEPQE
jgi:hypothetical protein